MSRDRKVDRLSRLAQLLLADEAVSLSQELRARAKMRPPRPPVPPPSTPSRTINNIRCYGGNGGRIEFPPLGQAIAYFDRDLDTRKETEMREGMRPCNECAHFVRDATKSNRGDGRICDRKRVGEGMKFDYVRGWYVADWCDFSPNWDGHCKTFLDRLQRPVNPNAADSAEERVKVRTPKRNPFMRFLDATVGKREEAKDEPKAEPKTEVPEEKAKTTA